MIDRGRLPRGESFLRSGKINLWGSLQAQLTTGLDRANVEGLTLGEMHGIGQMLQFQLRCY